jgi:Ca2+-binding EF-hand superfamily protein
VEVAFPAIHLTQSVFDDIFCSMLNNTTPFWEILQEDGKVDIYQAFISMVVFSSSGHFDDKIKTIFSFFDLDGNGDLERKELSVFVNSSIHGLCKTTGLPSPSAMGIQNYTVQVF